MTDLINKAREFCIVAHSNQFRKDGEDYYFHPIRVAAYYQAMQLSCEEDDICACYLHDTIEDCKSVDYYFLMNSFNKSIAKIVSDLTNTHEDSYMTRFERKRAQFHRLSKTNSVVKTIKLCDRLDNLKCLSNLNYKQNEHFIETYKKESLLLVEYIGSSNYQLSRLIKDLCR